VPPEFGRKPADPGPAHPGAGEDGSNKPKKYIVGGMVTVAVARERVQYLNAQGKLITESLRDYTRINLTRQYDSLDKFLQAWNDADRKAALMAKSWKGRAC
jgi:type I restriction enzyme R subunit